MDISTISNSLLCHKVQRRNHPRLFCGCRLPPVPGVQGMGFRPRHRDLRGNTRSLNAQLIFEMQDLRGSRETQVVHSATAKTRI